MQWASRPTRACELKSDKSRIMRNGQMSRPTRACELKSIDDIDYVMDLAASRPTRACELK